MACTIPISQGLRTRFTFRCLGFSHKCHHQLECPWHSHSQSPTPIYRLKLSRKQKLQWNTSVGLLQCNNTRVLPTIQCSANQVPVTYGRGGYSYEFTDDDAEVELRIPLAGETTPASEDVFLNVQDTSLVIAVEIINEVKVLLSIDRLYGRIKPAETVWYFDENDLVVSLKKSDVGVKWPDIMEAWHSLSTGVPTLLKGTSVYLVGDSSEINWEVVRELAVGLGYTPLQTSQLLEQVTQKTLDKLLIDEGENSVAEAEAAILASINMHVRVVVATIGGNQGAASRSDKWRNLHAGFTIWLSQSESQDEASAEKEARKEKQDPNQAYAAADVVVKLGGWDTDSARPAAEGCLRALRYFIESDKDLPGKKSLYIRMGCRGDWPNLMPPNWMPSSEKNAQEAMQVTT